MLVLLLLYGLGYSFLPTFKPQTSLVLHFVHSVFWCSFHYFGLGLLLRAQSQNKFLVRHYLKNYHYDDGGQGAIIEAFTNWKSIYNLSMCMTYGKSLPPSICLLLTIPSFLHWVRLEGVSFTHRLDRGRRTTSSHDWHRTFPTFSILQVRQPSPSS